MERRKINLVPHSGANEIQFGMTQAEVRNILGMPFHSEEASVFEFDDIRIDNPLIAQLNLGHKTKLTLIRFVYVKTSKKLVGRREGENCFICR